MPPFSLMLDKIQLHSAAAIALVAVISLLLGGCLTPEHRVSQLHTGMSKSEVLALLGPPKTAVHNGSLDVLNFDLAQPNIQEQRPASKWYYVIFGPDQRVESFGPDH